MLHLVNEQWDGCGERVPDGVARGVLHGVAHVVGGPCTALKLDTSGLNHKTAVLQILNNLCRDLWMKGAKIYSLLQKILHWSEKNPL